MQSAQGLSLPGIGRVAGAVQEYPDQGAAQQQSSRGDGAAGGDGISVALYRSRPLGLEGAEGALGGEGLDASLRRQRGRRGQDTVVGEGVRRLRDDCGLATGGEGGYGTNGRA